MSQINVNTPSDHVHSDAGDRTAAAGVNLLTVIIVLAVLAVLAWFLFTGPLRAIGGSSTNVNVNPPAQQAPSTINVNPPNVNVNVPTQAPAPAPANKQP